MRIAAVFAVASAFALLSIGHPAAERPAMAAVATQELSAGNPINVATYAQRTDLGFRFGFVDGVMGGVRDNDSYVFFGSAQTNAQCKGTPNTQGVYRLVPDPSDPTRDFSSNCKALLEDSPGTPNGSYDGPFDRDYVGGGPALRIDSTDGSRGILLVYHAEFHWGTANQCGSAPCFFGGLGMAISTDNGASFEKLGQIVQPYPSRSDWIQNNSTRDLSIGDGPFVLGDASAHAVDPRNANPDDTYIYVYYIDQDDSAGCGTNECLAVARALESDVIAAAFAHNTDAVPGLFKKYYQGSFSEPAATGRPNNLTPSGHFTSVMKGGFSPSALYDSDLGQVILATQDGNAIALRASSDLTDWSAPPVATVDDGPNYVRYPSLIGDVEANVGGANPLLYYTYVAPGSGASWPLSTFRARRLNVRP
jgi:hypothetical protein